MLKRTGLVVGGLLCLVVLTPAAAPVQLSYVYSDSMEPTIDRNDGYVLVPAGDVEVGDIVTFWSSEQESYVTHRIVGQSERGFITKGDANPSTDQAAGSPYVQADDIRGEVLTVRGTPVTVPGLGHLVRFVQGHRTALIGVLGGALLVGFLRDRTPAQRTRSVPRVRNVIWPVFAIAVLSTVGLQFAGGYSEEMTYVALDSDASGPNQLTVGEAATESLELSHSTAPMTTHMVRTEGMTITNRSGNASALSVTLRIPPPTETGVVRTSVSVHRYVTTLPMGVIRELHRVHPILAGSATSGVVLLPVGILMLLGIDGKRPVRAVESPTVRRLKREWGNL